VEESGVAEGREQATLGIRRGSQLSDIPWVGQRANLSVVIEAVDDVIQPGSWRRDAIAENRLGSLPSLCRSPVASEAVNLQQAAVRVGIRKRLSERVKRCPGLTGCILQPT
jgi:hypothetical protein